MEGVNPNVTSHPSSRSTGTGTTASTTTPNSAFPQLTTTRRHDTLSPQSIGATAEEARQLMRRERRTLSVPIVTYHDESSGGMMDSNGFLATSPQQGAGAGWPPLQQHHQQQQHSLGRPPLFNRSRSASTSALSPTAATPPGVKKKTVVACLRCRTRKIRCDGHLPACKSCVKAGTDCIEVDRSGDNNTPRSHVLELENRIRWLEGIIRDRAPDVDLQAGPPAELRSRPPPPDIRIVTAGHDFHPQPSPMSNTSSPVFALSPASTCATPASFDFSPGVSPAYLAPMSPYTFSDGPSPSPSPAPSSPMLSPFFQPQDPVAHDVGLLSLSAFEEPKYVGSSSGVSFAKLAFQDTLSTEFRAVDYDAKPNMRWPGLEAEPMALPTLDQCLTLSSAYFSTVALQYPFLHRHTFDMCLEATFHAEKGDLYQLPNGYSLPVARFHVFMVLSIGAGVLSAGGGEIDSEGFSASAMRMINEISITGSIPGVQSALLLAMRSLHSSEALNLWYLNALIMATCVDLGLQRKQQSHHTQPQSGLKRRIFWSAYALDRALGIALGRPFSLRDESLDVEFPGECDNDEEEMLGASLSDLVAARTAFSSSVCLFRMAKVLSGIKTTIYRVAQTSRWQGEPLEWQMTTFHRLKELREQARLSNPTATLLTDLVDLKFHESVQLLFRPSPTFPHPNPSALQHCFTSSVDSIRILSKLNGFGQLPHSWMTAHSLFLSGILMLYAHRNSRDPLALATADVLAEDIQTCSCLLAEFSRRYQDAARWRRRFDRFTADTVVHAAASRLLSPNDVRGAAAAAAAAAAAGGSQAEWFEGIPGGASGSDINMCWGLDW